MNINVEDYSLCNYIQIGYKRFKAKLFDKLNGVT